MNFSNYNKVRRKKDLGQSERQIVGAESLKGHDQAYSQHVSYSKGHSTGTALYTLSCLSCLPMLLTSYVKVRTAGRVHEKTHATGVLIV